MAASTPSNSESPGAPAANDSPFQLPKNFYLPKTTIYDIMKTSLPQYAKTAVPARETVQSCVTEFIMFVTGEASEVCKQHNKKTIGGDDVIEALNNLGFDEYVEPLKIYLSKYRQACFEEQQQDDATEETESDDDTRD